MDTLHKLVRTFFVVSSLAFGSTAPGQGQAASTLTLVQAVAAAEKHHPQLDEAQANRELARSSLDSARSARYPTLSVAEDIVDSNDPVFAFGSKLRQARFSSADLAIDSLNHPAAISNFSASASANWTAFDAGAARHRVASAAASLRASSLNEQYAAQSIDVAVTALYYRVLLAQDQITVADHAAARALEISGDLQDRVRSGLALESDGARAALALQQANDDIATAKANAAMARRDLFDAMGEADNAQSLSRPETQAPVSPASDLSERLDLQALRQQQQAARQDALAAHAVMWPRVSTFAHVESDTQSVATNGSGNWTVGAKIELPLFDGGVRKSHEEQATAHLHALEAQERSALLDARKNIGSLQVQLDDLQRHLTTAEAAIGVQQEALSTERDRYAGGLAPVSDVLNAEADLSSAEFQRIRTFYQLDIVRAELALAEGSLNTQKAGKP